MQRVLQGKVIYDKMSRRITPTLIGPVSGPEARPSLFDDEGPTKGQKRFLKTIKSLERKYGGEDVDQLNARLANAMQKKKKTKKVRKIVPAKIQELANKRKKNSKQHKRNGNNKKKKKKKKNSKQHKRSKLLRLQCKCKILKRKQKK